MAANLQSASKETKKRETTLQNKHTLSIRKIQRNVTKCLRLSHWPQSAPDPNVTEQHGKSPTIVIMVWSYWEGFTLSEIMFGRVFCLKDPPHYWRTTFSISFFLALTGLNVLWSTTQAATTVFYYGADHISTFSWKFLEFAFIPQVQLWWMWNHKMINDSRQSCV